MFDRFRNKNGGDREAGHHRHHRQTSSTSHRQSHRSHQPRHNVPDKYYADDSEDFVFRPQDAYDCSQPIEQVNFSANYPSAAQVSDEQYVTMQQQIDRIQILETLLYDAARKFARCHAGLRGSDSDSVFQTLLDSVTNGTIGNTANDGSSEYSSDDESEVSETPSSVSDTSTLCIVVMTKSEQRSWQRLSGLDSTQYTGVQPGVGRSDWLQPMRQAVTELALSTKRLEMRFGSTNMAMAVQQQHNMERLTIESQYNNGRSVEGLLPIGYGGDGKVAQGPPKSASVIVAQITDELAVLSLRLMHVQTKAEAGIVPLCQHALDLGEDRAPIASSSSHLPRSLRNTITDPRVAHANDKSDWFSIADVAKGYSFIGLTANTLINFTPRPGSEITGLTPVELAKLVWTRCDDDIRAQLGPEPEGASTWSQPASLLGQWLYTSSRADFHNMHVRVITKMIESALRNRTSVKCKCVSSSRSTAASSSRSTAASSSRSTAASSSRSTAASSSRSTAASSSRSTAASSSRSTAAPSSRSSVPSSSSRHSSSTQAKSSAGSSASATAGSRSRRERERDQDGHRHR